LCCSVSGIKGVIFFVYVFLLVGWGMEVGQFPRKEFQLLLTCVLVNGQGEDIAGHLHRKRIFIETGICDQILPMNGEADSIFT